jgi:hypothetical protein
MEHIIHSDVASQIRNNNKKRAEEINVLIKDTIQPIIDALDRAEKGDEALYVYYYIRKGNDFITHSSYVGATHTHISSTDAAVARL